MSDIKSGLLNSTEYNCAYGLSDLKHYLGRPLSAGACTVFICNEGRAIVSINFRKWVFKRGDIIFLFSDMVFIPISTSRNFNVFHCAVSSKLLSESTYNIPWDFYEYLYINPICSCTRQESVLLYWWQKQFIYFLENADKASQYTFIRNSLQNLFLAVGKELKKDSIIWTQSKKKDRAWILLNQFFTLLAKHCQENRNVSFYAEKLCISPYYLYKITQKIMKLSPKDLIDEQVVLEIKMYLSYTNYSVKEIAEKLCFEDPSYMCRFFRRYTEKSLSEYRSDFI